MVIFNNKELEIYKTEIQFLPPYRSHYWSLIYRIFMLATSIIIPIVGGCANSKKPLINSTSPLKITLREILSADTWVWIITGFTNAIGLIYYGVTHPKGSYLENEPTNDENVETLDQEEEEEDSVPLTRKANMKKLFRIRKKIYDKELGDILIERQSCLTDFYMFQFGLNYSIVFSNTLIFWMFQRDDFGVESMFVHSVLIWFVYVPFIWEWIQMNSYFVWFNMLVGAQYFCANLTFVKVSGEVIYKGLNWEEGYSYAIAVLAVLQIFIGYLLGEWFSKIQRRFWLPKWGRVKKDAENCNPETNLNLENLDLACNVSNNADPTSFSAFHSQEPSRKDIKQQYGTKS